MITAIDTNIIVGVLEGAEAVVEHLAAVIDRLAEHGSLFITPVVYAELLAAPSRSPAIVDAFLRDTPVVAGHDNFPGKRPFWPSSLST